MSTPTDPPTLRKKTASVPGATKLRAPTVLRATSMTTCQAQRTVALNLTGTQPTTVTYNEPIAVETPQIIEEGTPAVTLASDDAASVQDSLPGLQTLKLKVSIPGTLVAKAGAAQAMLVSSIKHATNSRAGGSPPGDVEVEAAVPPSVVPEASSPPKNGVETRVADTPVSAVRIADERTPPESVVGTEPGTTPYSILDSRPLRL
ncbi:hypothetical protein B0H14DRAFT_3463059 [Mycena olivaceomarginata]|nr:hypothetical protein B0H14DRAFT_3463059 [Mycena olivaceomarginata]